MDVAESSYIDQLNFNYNASDGSNRKFVGPLFNVDRSPQSQAVIWSQAVLARPTSSTSALPQTAISASLVTSSALPTPSTTSDKPSSALQSSETSLPLSVSKSSHTDGSDLGTGAIAGIVVGVVVCVGLAAALIFVLYPRRKSNNVQAGLPASFQAHAPVDFVGETHTPLSFVGEKDGAPSRPNELSGDFQVMEMATNNR